jgi:argininosuccinate lyase
MHNTPFTDMNDSEGETQGFGYQAFETGNRVLELFAALVADISIDGTRVADNIRRSCITVTELADTLVREEGLSFRQAHEIAAHVARAVVAMGGDLGKDGFAPFQQAFAKTAGRQSAINVPRFDEIVSVENFIAVRDRFGGPAPTAMDEALDAYRAAAATLREKIGATARREAEAEDELRTRFNALIGEPDGDD